jgi:hypothetical protein
MEPDQDEWTGMDWKKNLASSFRHFRRYPFLKTPTSDRCFNDTGNDGATETACRDLVSLFRNFRCYPVIQCRSTRRPRDQSYGQMEPDHDEWTGKNWKKNLASSFRRFRRYPL